jgi:hypothetical protein
MESKGYKYRLEPYRGMKTRHTCPRCSKKYNFARYVDIDGNYLGDGVGRCNSEASCGYHNPPTGNELVSDGFVYVPVETTYLKNYEIFTEKYQDNLFDFLCTKFDIADVIGVYDKYIVRSTNKKWDNSTVFYQKDIEDRFRTGKIIQYGKNGKRIKEPYSRIYWQHRFITNREFNLEQCLFGEHLLKGFNKDSGTIYLVESEKTCLIGSLCYENDLFLATGGLSNLSAKKLEVLKGYNIEAIPDKGGYDIWKKKLQPLGIVVNRVMEESDAEEGSDIADLLI